MQTQQYLWKFFQKHNIVRLVAKVSIVAVGLLLTGATIGTSLQEVQANYFSSCSASDHSYVVAAGDTLGRIASRYGMSQTALAAYNHIASANLIYTHQLICIPHISTVSSSHSSNTQPKPVAPTRSSDGAGQGPVVNTTSSPVVNTTPDPVVSTTGHGPVGHTNVFPYGACTWWANQRYYQIHGFFVPWTAQANAGQWVARAHQFGWHVSSVPAVGDIMVLQPGVQGAYWLGHVAIVERVLSNGHVIASSMSWGSRPWAVTTWQFTPGPGVAFVTR
ncbi:MAG TPA: CHAP domain-containing protein [Ktedonobacteraceae bacterium]|nr:CHAP domain-containing protein [Ktedonobacteraceae bacterium]